MNSIKKVCSNCNKYVDKSNFARHQASRNNVIISCNQCSMKFNRKDSYKRHLSLHGNIQNDANEESNVLPSLEFTIDDKKVIENLVNFQVKLPNIPFNNKTPDFKHPFTCKVIGPRGSGKTSFTVSYIQQIACLTFAKIYIVTASPDQPLNTKLKEKSQVYFIALDELDSVVKSNRDILIVLDDMMRETRFSHMLEVLYTGGRHQHISIISLEQDLFYSSHVERRNADYFILMRIRDFSCMQEFYKRYCRDVQQWRFIELYEMAVKPVLGYMIIDFVSPQFKYRINALNIYYNSQHRQLRYIIGKADDTIKEKNIQLQYRFHSFLANGKTKNVVAEQADDSDYKEAETECPLCREYLPDNTNLRDAVNQHLETEHKILFSVNNTPVCGFCNKDFKSISDVVKHIEQTHQHKIVS